MRDLFQNRVFKIEIDLNMSLLGPGGQVAGMNQGGSHVWLVHPDICTSPSIHPCHSAGSTAGMRSECGIFLEGVSPEIFLRR